MKNIAETVEDIVNKRVRELEDRKNRALNVVIFELKTSESALASERKAYDIDILKKLFAALCPEAGELEMKTCFRLTNRKKTTEPKGPAPLKVILASKEQRRLLLQNSKNIASLSDVSLKGLIIARDLTAEQRSAQKVNKKKKKPSESAEPEGATGGVDPSFLE